MRRKTYKRPKHGDLRVYNIVNLPNDADFYPVTSPLHGAQLIDALANSQLLDDTVHSNVFGLEVFESGEWLEWQDEDGFEIGEADVSELE